MATIAIPQTQQIQRPSRLTIFLRYLRRNPGLAIGLTIILLLVAFTVIGLLTIKTKNAYPLSVASKQPPSAKYPDRKSVV